MNHIKNIARIYLGVSSFLWICLSFCQQPLSLIVFIHEDAQVSQFLNNLVPDPIFLQCEVMFLSKETCPCQEVELLPYLDQYKNIHHLKSSDPNATYGSLMNEAITLATTPYIMHTFIEDTFNPDALTTLIQELDKDPTIDAAYTLYYAMHVPNLPFENIRKWYGVNPPSFEPLLLSYNGLSHYCIWRKDIHTKYGYFNEYLTYLYFWEYWNRAFMKGATFKKIGVIAGDAFVSYWNPRTFFYTHGDYEKWYHEDKFIRDMYGQQWQFTEKSASEKPFVFIIASYNNKKWYKRNLDSVFHQHYHNYRIIYIEDASPDNTGEYVQQYIHQQQQESRVTLIRNEHRKGAMANIYHAAHLCKKEEIIIILDGDDWTAHDEVLSYLNTVYQNPDVWLTYGQFSWFPSEVPGFCAPLPEKVIETNGYRAYGWTTSHLRTFYAGLFHHIKKEDLEYEGQFFASAADLAIMYPMLELSGKHTQFVPHVLHIYNNATHLNDHKTNQDLQLKLTALISSMPPYQPLQTLF